MSDLSINIQYYKNGEYEISGNVKEGMVPKLIDDFLRAQGGRGEDHSKPNEQEMYSILMNIDLSQDTFYVKSDTGNKGLRDGMLMDVSSRERKRLKEKERKRLKDKVGVAEND